MLSLYYYSIGSILVINHYLVSLDRISDGVANQLLTFANLASFFINNV
ncbi:hypothetical protein VAE122_2980266 [Vibrio aestuarianus]|nr:hypothetical protein VAEU17_300013 [Vibrio aestuarianus]CAH8222283.1 hypothetical protein VAE122_2980266 [Vibrio aestuarianus]CAH8223494.1 hypothetical protein VAEKB19_4210021 [Vibrio aestuarianus]